MGSISKGEKLKLVLSVFLLFLSLQNSYAFPLIGSDFDQTQLEKLKQLSLFNNNYDFEGIVALNNCSGSLVRFEQSLDTDNAMVLTNGHCLGQFIAPGDFVYGVQDNRSFTLLSPTAESIGRLHATQIMYATMSKTDLALYKLRRTFADIQNEFSIRPLTLAKEYANIGTDIEIISGLWRTGFSCQIETFVFQLQEADWMYSDSIRYSRPGCETYSGTSGSPVLAKGTRTVIGINNTGNDGGKACTLNNPCEISEDGTVFYEKGISYAQQTSWVYSCLNTGRDIDLAIPGCKLPH